MEPKEKYWIVLLPGDGVGVEVVRESVKILKTFSEHSGVQFELEEIPCGGSYYVEHGLEWPIGSFEKCKGSDAILLGAVGHVIDGKDVFTRPGQPYEDSQLAGYAQVIENRKKLQLYANVRPIKLYPNVPQKFGGKFVNLFEPEKVDYVIVRENTEGEYSGKTYPITDDKGIDIGKYTPINITQEAAERIIRFAFRLAKKRNKKNLVTCVEKSNIIGAHNYFREIFTEIHKKEFPEMKADYAYFDAFCQWQMKSPEWFDVVVAPNLVGDVTSDNGSTTAGGLGFAAGGNIGDHHAMFEPIHGSAPKYTGQDKVNPIACIAATSMMLDWLGERYSDPKLLEGAKKIEGAIIQVMAEGKVRTYDIGGNSKCSEMGEALRSALEKSYS